MRSVERHSSRISLEWGISRCILAAVVPVVLTTLTVSSRMGHAAALVDFAINPSNNHVYYLIQAADRISGVTWTEAEAAAIGLGGHLATVNDAAENGWVTSAFTGNYYLWIGLNDAAQEGDFVWSSGQPVTYTNWWPGEPNNYGGDEDYVHIYNFANGAYKWNDLSNTTTNGGYPMYGVVEVDAPPERQPGEWWERWGYDLPVIEKVELGNNRASQGITSDGDRFYTSKTYDPLLGDVERSLSRFQSNWLLDGWNLNPGENPDWEESPHIGGIAVDETYVYAAIDFSTPGLANSDDLKIAYYSKDESLSYVDEWDISNLNDQYGVRALGGVGYDDGKLYVVEYGLAGNHHIAVYDIQDLRDGIAVPEVYEITTDKANGIEINGDWLYVSWGMPGADLKGRIDVFHMDELNAGKKRPLKALDYHVPWDLHAEDLLYDEGELWVAKGDWVARLDTSKFPTSLKRSTGSGFWRTIFGGGERDEGIAAVIDGGSVQIAAAAVASDAIVENAGSLVLQHDGSMTLGDRLDVRNGTYVVQGGDLQVANLLIGFGDGGAFEITDASSAITVSETIALGPNGSISAVPGSTIHMTGSDLENSSTTPGDYADMINLSMIFEGGDQVIDFFEVAGEDMGATADGETLNFGLGGLVLGGESGASRLVLLDLFDNQPTWEGTEALYLNDLIVNLDSTLYLNDINLYVNSVIVSPGEGDLYGGGEILSVIPEPSTMILLSMGAVGLLAYALRKRRRC